MHAHHERHHQLIDERAAAWTATPRRSGVDRIRRRERAKRAMWTLRDHLRCCHGVRNMPHDAGWDDLIRLHDDAHGAAGDV